MGLGAAAPAASDDKAKSRRRWWPRFSIRLLLVITAIVGGFLALRQRSVSQHAAADRLIKKGVKFGLSEEADSQSRFSKLLFGDDQYDTAITITVKRCELSQAEWQLLPLFPGVKQLQIESTETSGALSQVAKLPKLTMLWIEDSAISAEDFRLICGCEQLAYLILPGVELAGADFSQLRSLARLQNIYLRGEHVTDHALHGVAQLPQVTSLVIVAARVTDAGCADVAKLPQLRNLMLESTPVTGSCLHGLGDSKIESLDLYGTKVGSAAIDDLIAMRKLKIVTLSTTKVTKEDIARLKTARPNLSIRSDYPDALNSAPSSP